MNIEDELHRVFTDERLAVPVRDDAVEVLVAGARRVRRRRIAVWATVAVVTAPMLAAGAIMARVLVGTGGPNGPTFASPPTVDSAPVGNRLPGSSTVLATPEVWAHPLHPAIQDLLQDHFDAINAKDYGKWLTTVSAKRAEGQSEQAWHQAYRTTRDGGMVIQRIDQESDRSATALVTFISVQEPENAPADLPVHCIRWRATFSLIVENNAWKIGWRPTNSPHEKC